MTPAEHHLLMLAQIWILASIPLALVAFQFWFRKSQPSPAEQPVIPHEDASPAGSFLDVSLPPPALPLPEEKGVPVRQWKRVDGWMALLLVAVLGILMGPMLITPEKAEGFTLSSEQMGVQLAFQTGFVGLVLFYLSQIRRLDLTKIFGLRRYHFGGHLGRALAWLIPGMGLVMLVTIIVTPLLLKGLHLPKPSDQLFVSAIKSGTDPLTSVLVFLSACVAAPLMEEVIFRGFLYGVAKRFTHISYAALASALMFAVIHANVMSFVPLTLLGLLFVAAYEYTGSLLVPMIMHGCFNFIQLSLLYYGPELIRLLEKGQ